MPSSTPAITPEALLEHWQGHRRLTRRVIDAFSEDQLFSFRVSPMRPFGMMALELIGMGVSMAQGIATGKFNAAGHHDPQWVKTFTDAASPKTAVLTRWDEDTDSINSLWAQIPAERFQETITAYGQYRRRIHLADVRRRQRDPSPRSGLRIPATARDRNSAVLCAVTELSNLATSFAGMPRVATRTRTPIDSNRTGRSWISTPLGKEKRSEKLDSSLPLIEMISPNSFSDVMRRTTLQVPYAYHKRQGPLLSSQVQ